MKRTLLTLLIVLCYNYYFGQAHAVRFSGSNSSIDIGTNAGNGLRTIECWFRPSVNISPSINDSAYSLIVRNDSELKEFGMYIIGKDWTINKGKLAFYVRYNGVVNQILSNLDTWSANTWYHVAGTIDPINGMKLYIDGVVQTDTKPSFTNATLTDSRTTKIGTWGDANIRYFKGDIDEVRFWNRALSGTEINAKKCCLLNPTNETGLVSYWHFEEGSGSGTNEVINNTNNTLSAGVSWVGSNNCISNLTTWYLDQDNDNHASQTTLSCQSPGNGWTTNIIAVNDCDDQNALIYPGQIENYLNTIDDNCDAIIQYQITANSNSGGTISPNGNTIVNQGANQAYQITPQNGYYIQDVLVDGVSIGTSSSYFFNSIQAPHTIVAIFAQLVPSVTITSDDNDNVICQGSNVTFVATPTNISGPISYSWRRNGLAVGAYQSTYTANYLANNDIITCVINPGVNQLTSNAIAMAVNPKPYANLWTSGNKYCDNMPYTNSAIYLGNTTINETYQWYNNGTLIQGETQSFLPLGIGSNFSALGNYSVYVVVTDIGTSCTNQSFAQSFTVTTTPTVSISGTPLCSGMSATLTANGSQDVTTYNWIGNQFNGSTTTQTANVSTSGTYSVVVHTSFGCMARAGINVFPAPQVNPQITTNKSTSICEGENIVLTATDLSNSSSTYQWTTGETTANITATTAGDYSVTITNPFGCNSSTHTVITVNSLPTISIVSSNGTSLCNGNNTTLTANGASSYVWNTGATTNNINITATTNTNYVVTGTDNNGCSATANININIANNCPSINSTYCNRTITNFSSQGIVANIVSGATNYEFRFEEVNSTGTVIYTAYGTSTTNIISLVNVTNPGLLHYNAHYLTSVRVSSDNGSTWTAFGTKCNLYTLQPPNTPNNGYCGIHRNNLLSIYSVNPMGLATQYKIRYRITGSSNYLYYTFPAGQNSVVLQNIPGIVYNTTYEVQISSLVPYSYNYQTSTTEYDWSPYGNMCFFYMDHPANNPNNGYCGIHRNNLNNIYSVNTMGMARQYKLRLRVNGDNDPTHYIVHTLPLGATAVTLSNIPGLTYNTVYTVEISSDVPYAYDATTGTYSYNWSPYGTPCLFYIDHPANNPNNGYCGIHRNNLNNIYSVNTMGMARQYKLRLRVNGDNDPTHYIEHILPLGATAVTLSNIPGLTYNTVYNVEISSDVPYSYDYLTATTSYSWSPYGTPCLLYIDEPANNPASGYCGIQRNIGVPYCASPISKASQYKFRLKVNNDPSNTYIYSNTFSYSGSGNLCFILNSTNVPGLQNNTHYKIEISTYVPYTYDVINQTYTYSNWSPYGSICDLYIGNPPSGSRTGLSENLEISDEKSEKSLINNITIFPNPSNGLLNINFENAIDSKYNIEVFDIYGKSVYRTEKLNTTGTEFKSEINLSDLNLANGLYLINVNSNNQSSAQRIMIEK